MANYSKNTEYTITNISGKNYNYIMVIAYWVHTGSSTAGDYSYTGFASEATVDNHVRKIIPLTIIPLNIGLTYPINIYSAGSWGQVQMQSSGKIILWRTSADFSSNNTIKIRLYGK